MVEKAKLLGLDPSKAERATISNLRTIAPKAYWAAYNNQPAELDRLFQPARNSHRRVDHFRYRKPLKPVVFKQYTTTDFDQVGQAKSSYLWGRRPIKVRCL